jgi:putative alpha-1,2-mannosidase
MFSTAGTNQIGKCGVALLLSLTATAGHATTVLVNPGNAKAPEQGNSQWVYSFIGSGGDGHTFPGAVVPFGMVQLSPDTAALNRGVDPQSEIYKHSAGYHYDDKTITGFSHTHFSGSGHSDLGDLLIMPMTGKAHIEPGTVDNPDSGYRFRFNHDSESASPGYYSVQLQDYDIKAELTATTRTGMQHHITTRAPNGQIIITSESQNFS